MPKTKVTSTTAKTTKTTKPKAAKPPARKTVKKAAPQTAVTKPRKIKIARRRWWQLRRRGPKPVMGKIPSSWFLFKQSFRAMWRHKGLYLRILIVFALLNLILVRGFSGSGEVASLKDSVLGFSQGNFNKLGGALSIFAYVTLSSNNEATPAAGAYQVILIVVGSLAVIWTIRQLAAEDKARLKMRDAFYRGMGPLVPFICEVLLAVLCLVPFALGATIYSTVITYGIIARTWEYILYGSILVILSAISLRIVVAPFVGIYISTLPDMTPLRALRSAKQLVRFRRWNVLRKALFFAVAIILLAAVVLVPVIFIFAPAAPWVFFALLMILLVLFHQYFYGLYRELIKHAP